MSDKENNVHKENVRLTEEELKKLGHDDLVKLINNYTQLTRERDLTKEESDHRELCRNEYKTRVTNNLRGTLSNIKKK